MGVRGGAGRDIQSPSPEQGAKRKVKAKCFVGAAAISMSAPPIHFPGLTIHCPSRRVLGLQLGLWLSVVTQWFGNLLNP